MTAIVRFQNSCKIIDEEDLEIFKALDKELSYKIQGAEFSQAYKGYINDQGEFVSWDGRRHLMSSTGKFPVGLFTRAVEFFHSKGIYPQIIDKRPPYEQYPEINILPQLEALGKPPRHYQLEAADKAVKTDRGIIRLATGSGKSLVAALITAKLGKPTIIYVIGTDLLYQFQKLFSDVFQTEIGIIGDGKCEIRDINIATIWSVGQALGLKKNISLDDSSDTEKKMDPSKFRTIKEMLLNSNVHILDECHMAACSTVQTISKNIKAEHVYGMSASPWRDDNGDLLIEAFLGNKIIDLSAKLLIQQGFLVQPDIRFFAPKPYPYKSGAYQRVYSKYVTENNQRNEMIVKGTAKMVEDGFIPLVLFHSLKHGNILFDSLKNVVPTALLSGKDSSKIRDKIKDEIETGKIKCIVASKIFDIGIDLPILSGLVCAGAGKSSVRALQRIGRVIRPYNNKKIAAVMEFADQAPYLSDHAEIRKQIYQSEFEVKWPQRKT